jgi:hypothetical protein
MRAAAHVKSNLRIILSWASVKVYLGKIPGSAEAGGGLGAKERFRFFFPETQEKK